MATRGASCVLFGLTALAVAGCPAKQAPPTPPWSVTLGESEGASWCSATGDACAPASAAPHAAGALLQTSAEGRALATLDDETTAELGPSASIVLTDGDPRVVDVRSGTVAVRRTPRSPSTKHPRVVVRVGAQTAELDAKAPTVVAVHARDGGDRSTLSVEHGTVAFKQGSAATELRAGDTASVTKGQNVDRRGVFSGTVARVELPRHDDAPRGAPRGLGTMTARVPGTEEVVAGVHLASHHVRAIVQDGFSRTEVEEVFANDSDRVVEGRYVFAVPPRAITARLALWVGDKLVEDEIVEKKKAAAIFKEIVDDTVRPRDPALLEWVASGELSLKVFPIPAKGSRKIVLAYDEALPNDGGELRYVYPLSLGEARANKIDDLSISVTAYDPEGAPIDVETPHYAATVSREAKKVTATFDAKSFTPVADFVLAWRAAKPAPADGAAFVPAWGAPADLGLDRTAKAAGDQSYAAVRLAVGLPPGVEPPPFKKRDRVIVVDTSQSQSRETLDAEVKLALATARLLEPDERVALLACDSACSSYPDTGLAPAIEATFAAAEAWAKGLSPAGSSDVAGALLDAASRLDDGAGGQIVVVGDGASTSGELTPAHAALRAKPRLDKKKADVRFVGAGATVDAAALSLLARELGATYQPLVTGEPLARRVDALAASFRRPVVRAPKVKLPGTMSDVYPRALPNLVLGEQVVLVGKLSAPSDAAIELTGDLDGAEWKNEYALVWGTSSDHQAAVVPRLWAAQKIDELLLARDPKADKESIELSKRFHVLSRLTSMLVLENDAMFAAYGIKRTVAPDGSIAAQSQAEQLQLQLLGALGGMPASGLASSPGAPPSSLDDIAKGSSGVTNGGLNLGPSGGGPVKPGGSGGLGDLADTRSGNNSTTTMPRGDAQSGGVSASSPVANADAVVARNRFRFRACYQKGLVNDPSIAGRVLVTINVGPSGEVTAANAAPSGNIPPSVAACIAAACRNMVFSPPDGGNATLRVPITFVQQGTTTQPQPQPQPQPQYAPPAGPTALTRASDDAWRTAGDDAIAKLRATSDASPQSRMKREALVRGLLARGRFEQALTMARAFVEADPDLPVARELLSYAAAASGDAKTALLAVDAAVETNALSVKSHLRAARAFEASGDERRACAHWRSLAEIDAADEWRYQALRCRARALGDREAAASEGRAIDKPSKLLEKLVPLLADGDVPAYDPSTSSLGQMEVSVTCSTRDGCPIPVVVAPNGAVFSPMTPADARSAARAVAITVLRDGAYHTMLVGGADDAKGEVVVRAAGVTQKYAFAKGGAQSIAVSDVSVPQAWLGGLGSLARINW